MMDAYRESFSGFQPEVPQGTYAAVRKKMAKTSFWSFGLTSLNVFTVAILLGLGAFSMWALDIGTGGLSSVMKEPAQLPHGSIEKIHQDLTVEAIEPGSSKNLKLALSESNKTQSNSCNHVYPEINDEGYPLLSGDTWILVPMALEELPLVEERHERLHEDGVLADINQQLDESFDSMEIGASSNSEEVMDNVKEGKGKTILTLKTIK